METEWLRSVASVSVRTAGRVRVKMMDSARMGEIEIGREGWWRLVTVEEDAVEGDDNEVEDSEIRCFEERPRKAVLSAL